MDRLEFEAPWILFLRKVTQVRWNPERYQFFKRILILLSEKLSFKYFLSAAYYDSLSAFYKRLSEKEGHL